ncbi:MAG: hypothetical protein O7E57_10965 [Gammaproteobacteria bacterium]|nr:hypothetical protein [Gammaproteobacteria bacterium]
MLTLYGVPASQASRCMWALAELDVEYRLELVRANKDTNAPALVALNPNGKIRRYGSPLWPASEADRAPSRSWRIISPSASGLSVTNSPSQI